TRPIVRCFELGFGRPRPVSLQRFFRSHLRAERSSRMGAMRFDVVERAGFRYIDEGRASDLPPILLLHGMLGDLSNWNATIGDLAAHKYRVLVPVLPVYALPLKETSVQGLVRFVDDFLNELGVTTSTLVGNSLGGQVALLYTLEF